MKTLKNLTRTLMVCTAFCITAHVFTACDKITPPNNDNEKPPVEEEKPKPRIVKKPSIIIPSTDAKRHYDLYTPRARRIEKEIRVDPEHEDFRATRSLYLSKKDLEQYLAYIEQESKKVGVEPNGIRFFFSVYPEDYKRTTNGSTQDAKKQTVFFAPTLDKKLANGMKFPAYTIGGKKNDSLIFLQDILDGKTIAHNNGDTDATIQEANFLTFFTTAAAFGDEKSLVGNSMHEWPDDE